MAGKDLKLSILSQLANEDTNLHNAPMRYMDHSSYLAGTPFEYAAKYHPDEDPLKYDAHGLVDEARPDEVYLADYDLSKAEAMKVLPHEGTHSKQTIARNTKGLPDLTPDLIESVKYLMEANPEFLRDFLGHSEDKRSFQDINNFDELLDQREIMARLQAIEAMSPKGQMIEKSKYTDDLFGSGEEIDKYLRATVPEGFINSRSVDSFRPAKPKSKPWPGPLELFRRLAD